MSRSARLLGLDNATPEGISLAVKLATLIPAFSISFQLSTTFYMIFIAEQLGNGDYLVGLGMVGVLLMIQTVVQTILDYPTGALGDTIGHKYVIASALLCYGAAFWVTSLTNPLSPYWMFVAIYVLLGVGISQESGAWGSWFDNNYRIAMPQDQERKQYGVFQGRLNMLSQLTTTAVIIPGSILALILQRTWVFQLQAVLTVILAIVVLRTINDLPGARPEKEERPSLSDYGSNMKEGLLFLKSSRFIGLLLLGELFLFSVGPVWGSLLLWPFYFSYLFTDIGVSGFRTLLFGPLAVMSERAGVLAKKFDPTKWVPRFRLLGFIGAAFSLLLAMIVIVFPPPAEPGLFYAIVIPGSTIPIFEFPAATLIPVFLTALLFIVSSLFGGISGILTQRVLIDVVPNKIRNGLYSLRATLIVLASLPLFPFFGWVTPEFGFAASFLWFFVITTIGTILIWLAFKNAIPKAKDLEVVEATGQEDIEIIEVT
ncbi:MAG: MFS transporter [Candidatus Thorarchaeota archaeon]|nr:MFS transporter [Candidatus Thorarchaeota archaeon]